MQWPWIHKKKANHWSKVRGHCCDEAVQRFRLKLNGQKDDNERSKNIKDVDPSQYRPIKVSFSKKGICLLNILICKK